jgi:hypothetical protein
MEVQKYWKLVQKSLRSWQFIWQGAILIGVPALKGCCKIQIKPYISALFQRMFKILLPENQ